MLNRRFGMMNKLLLSLVACVTFSVHAFAQPTAYPMGFGFTRSARSAALRSDSLVFLSMQPYSKSDLPLSKMEGERKDSVKLYHDLAELLLRKDLLVYEADGVRVRMNLLYDLRAGSDYTDTVNYSRGKRLVNNMRGLWVQADFGKRFSVETGFYESQQYLPKYLKSFVDSTGVLPGLGRTKPFHTTGVDYALSFSRITCDLNTHLRASLGYGKHKIGHGYRSLLWSDGAFNYPYVQADWKAKHWRFSHVWNVLQDQTRLPLGSTPESLFRRKGGSFSLLSWKPSNRWEISLFEAVIWSKYNDNGLQSMPLDFYSPIIGTGLINWNSKQNKLLCGLDFQHKLTNHWEVFGQLLFDGDQVKKQRGGLQLGLSGYNLGLENLDLGFEYNRIQPGVYTSQNMWSNYSTTAQFLGMPLNNITEFIVKARYRYDRYFARVKYNYLTQAFLLNESDARMMHQVELECGYWFNPKTNSEILISYTDRIDHRTTSTAGVNSHSSIVMIGLRTSLHALYKDF